MLCCLSYCSSLFPQWKPQDGSHLHSPGLPKVNMPPVRAGLVPKLTNAQAVRLDDYCGVDAQSKAIFEDEHEASIPQSKISLLDQTGTTIPTSIRLPLANVLMIVVGTGRMKNSLSRGDLVPNVRNAIFAWQSFYYDEVSPSLKSYCVHPLKTTSFTVALPPMEQRRLVYQATVITQH